MEPQKAVNLLIRRKNPRILREDEPAGPKDKSLDIMLKIVQGMQNMQQQMLDTKKKVDHGEDTSETVKNVTSDLPKLVEYKPESAPIDLGDWICVLEPIMAAMLATSSGIGEDGVRKVSDNAAAGKTQAAAEGPSGASRTEMAEAGEACCGATSSCSS